jgi:exodeoxyribonuclease-3
MKLVSWNINSLRLRLPLLKEFVKAANPDVICLQETKVQDLEFPLLEVKNLGFDFVEFAGEKSYNGVAILSKFPIKNISVIDVLNYGHKRHISCEISTKIGEINLHNFYIPAGGDIADVNLNDKFDHKLKFVDWMSEFFSQQKNKKLIIVGDFNIAPLEHDVWSHKQLLKIVSHTPIEVEKLTNLQNSLAFIDTHRYFTPENEKLYSWWSYRARNPLEANKGRRLDHIWATPNLKDYLDSFVIYRHFRSAKQPSDHVPIQTNFNF